MKLFKLDLLTLLISLFILASCKSSDEIGLEPQNAIQGTLIDTVTIQTATVPEDPIATNNLSKFPVGFFKDPIFGTTKANLATSLNLPSTELTFGTAPVLDSAVLVLKYATDGYYGDASANLKFDVYQLAEKLKSNTVFYNTEERTFNAPVLGTRTLKVNTKDSILITEIVKGKPDINKNQPPQIRIPINAAFINNNFLNAGSDKFKTNTAFNDFIKGLFITVNDVTGAGGIAFLDLATSGGSKLELYYKNTNDTVIDTVLTSFAITSSSPVAAEIKHDYTGTSVQTQLSNPNTVFDFNYIQPMAGVRTRINFPFIEKLKSLGTNVSINKAELIVLVEGGTDTFKPAPRLFLYQTDIAGQRQFIPDANENNPGNLSSASLGGFYDPSQKRYKFALTSYIQNLVNGKEKQYNTYISSIDSLSNRNSALPLSGVTPASGSTAGRVVIGSAKSTATYKIKLNIIYSKND
ncbi:MAG: DUF4270 domain-containing protein [Daejeonella sp.]